MKPSKKRNSVVTLTTLLFTTLLSPQSYGGAITSANAPPPPPPPNIPGLVRLSCTLNISSSHVALGRKQNVLAAPEERLGSSAEALLDFEKEDGSANFKCVEGCDNLTWTRNRSSWPAGEMKPVSKTTGAGQISLPSLNLKMIDAKPFLATRVESAHRSWTGNIVSSKTDSLVPFEGRNFYAEARTDEAIDNERIDELKRLATKTKRTVLSSSQSFTQFRCTVLQPGQMSKAQIYRVQATPPRAGTISAQEYEKATSMDHISQPYKTVLDLARKIDPDHRKAMLAESAIIYRDIEFLKPVAQKVRDTAKAHSDMTAENAWGFIAQLLGISPMSPSGVVLPSIVPLLIAEEEAEAK